MKITAVAFALLTAVAVMTAGAPEAQAFPDCKVTYHPACLIFGG
jgi:hypothetical protein